MNYGKADFESLVAREYSAAKDCVYLDHAASTLVPACVVEAHAHDLRTRLYVNPHSSLKEQESINRARHRVLDYLFNLSSSEARKDWAVVFTSGATASLRLLADSYFKEGAAGRENTGDFVYLKQSHTSLVGMRNVALSKGGAVRAASGVDDLLAAETPNERRMYAYTAQCNVSGRILGLEPCRSLKRQHPDVSVLVDAAAYLAGSQLDLASIKLEEAPDFIALSFYKIFGYPTGLGALIIKRSTGKRELTKNYFGGGTVDGIGVDDDLWMASRKSLLKEFSEEAFEDGTLPFLEIAALGRSMDFHEKTYGSLNAVGRHTSALLSRLEEGLTELKHYNGNSAVKIHGNASGGSRETANGFTSKEDGKDASLDSKKATSIALSILTPSGQFVGHMQVQELASLSNIHIRTGGLCNTGALATVFDIDDSELKAAYASGRACWDDNEFLSSGKPLGVVRVSLGACSTLQDVERWISFVEEYFVKHDDAPGVTHTLFPNPNTANFVKSHKEEVEVSRKKSFNLLSKESPETLPEESLKSIQEENFKSTSEDSTVQETLLSSSNGITPHYISPGNQGASTLNAPKDHNMTPDLPNDSLNPLSSGYACLEDVSIYPIKSCAAQHVFDDYEAWSVVATGLEYDRQWAIVDVEGKILSQKRYPKMALIKPKILATQESTTLLVEAPEMPALRITLGKGEKCEGNKGSSEENEKNVDVDSWSTIKRLKRLNGALNHSTGWLRTEKQTGQILPDSRRESLPTSDPVKASLFNEVVELQSIDTTSHSSAEIDAWFSTFLSMECKLHEQNDAASRHSHFGMRSNPNGVPIPLSLSNESPFLLVSNSSVDQLNSWLSAHGKIGPIVSAANFRGNFVISGQLEPFSEDRLGSFTIGTVAFEIIGKCRRCNMICVDGTTGKKHSEPLSTLSKYRRDPEDHRVYFGVHCILRPGDEAGVIHRGDVVGWGTQK